MKLKTRTSFSTDLWVCSGTLADIRILHKSNKMYKEQTIDILMSFA